MLIPIRCFTCGKTLADKWDYYDKLVKEQEQNLQNSDQVPTEGQQDINAMSFFDKVKTGPILDKLGLTRYCCRRHMLGQVDMMTII
jgi:DNA-directed RNA polymerase I, II, and III subunit RPABC5